MNNNRRASRREPPPRNPSSTPTGSYVVTPKTAVSPGTLSKKVNQILPPPSSLHLQQKESLKSSVKLPKTSTSSHLVPVNPKSSLVVGQSQGVFEVHLKHLDLADNGLRTIENQFDGSIPSLRLSWKFLSFERSNFPIAHCIDKHIEIEASILYKIDMNENFFEYVLTRHLSLELYGRAAGKEIYLARGEINLVDCIESPHTELYCYVDLCDIDKALVLSNTGIAVVYGTLTLWYRLSCDIDVLHTFYNKSSHIYYSPSTAEVGSKHKPENARSSIMHMLKAPEQRQQSMVSRRGSLNFHIPLESASEDSESMNSLEPTDSEIENFQEALDLVLSRNKALRMTQSEISNDLRDRAGWLHEEANWKRTLQEHAILSGKDPIEVQWRQWRTESTANVKLRKYQSEMAIYKPEVVITVEFIKLYTSSPLFKSPKFQKFYVEYTFLTHNGIDMECPFSVPKSPDGKRMTFNFTKTFPLNLENNADDCHKLAEVIKSGEELTFVVVGEPGENTNEYLCCEEVTSCSLNMLELVDFTSNDLNESLPLLDPNSDEEIGYMRIRISGILAMRRLALQLLAPSGFSILD